MDEHTKLFIAEAISGDSVAVENSGMRCQTGENGGGGIIRGPIQDAGESAPVRLVSEIRLDGLSARDDCAVELAVAQCIESGVISGEVLFPAFASHKIGKRKQLQVNRNVARGRFKKFTKLQLSVFERRIRHVVN